MNSAPFTDLALRPELQVSITTLGYEVMTPVQEQTLPHLLSGKDLIAQAKTGSGKTAAFAIGLLNKLEAQSYCTQALVLCPTRELADQVAAEIRRLASTIPNTKLLTLCGGKPMGPQLASLRRDPHIIVGTPGRILKHIEKETLHLEKVETLVLDEADRMLDMGFHDDIP
jgi:ATP-independent RNA helicase DbpA